MCHSKTILQLIKYEITDINKLWFTLYVVRGLSESECDHVQYNLARQFKDLTPTMNLMLIQN